MWNPMQQLSDSINPDHQQQQHAVLDNGKNASCQVVYVVKSPLGSDEYVKRSQTTTSPYQPYQGDRRRTSSDEGFADEPLTDGDGTWLWLHGDKIASEQKRRRWLRQTIGVAAAAAALILTVVVLVTCFRMVSTSYKQASSAALEVSINDLSLDLLRSENEDNDVVTSTAAPSTALDKVSKVPEISAAEPKMPKAPEVPQVQKISSLSTSTTSTTAAAAIKTEQVAIVTTAPVSATQSDEVQCKSDQFFCPQGRVRHRYVPGEGDCISSQRVCDGTIDCVQGTDESNCTCRAHEFRCRDGVDRWRGSECVPRTTVCDRVADCLDDSDEQNCTFTCPAGQSICAAGRVRLPRRVSSDRSLQPFCVRWAQLCDGTPDCEDGSDEMACASDTCPPGMARCFNGTTEVESRRPTPCLRRLYWCDRLPHCSDGSDEQDCIYRCPWGKFACATGEPVASTRSLSAIGKGCLFNKQRCNGIVDCRDGSDEEGC